MVFLAGLFFLPAPGPGFIVVAVGAALIARESRRAARLLDSAEVKGRAAWRWGRRRWDAMGTVVRALVVLLAAAVSGAGLWAAWSVFLG